MGSIRRVAVATKLVLKVQQKSHFLTVYLGVAVATVVAFRFAIPEEWVPIALPAILLGEPGTMGIYLVAAYRYLEKNEKSWTSLLVSPLRLSEYLLALVLGTSLVAAAAGTFIVAAVVGPERALLAAVPLALTAIVAGLIGFGLSLRYSEFTRFIVGSIPAVTLYSLPFFTLFGILPTAPLRVLPSTASLEAFRLLSSPGTALPQLALETTLLLGFDLLLFLFVAYQLERRLSLEVA